MGPGPCVSAEQPRLAPLTHPIGLAGLGSWHPGPLVPQADPQELECCLLPWAPGAPFKPSCSVYLHSQKTKSRRSESLLFPSRL